MNPKAAFYINQLKNCSKGTKGWRHFENICIDIIQFLFVPPLNSPTLQLKTISGISRIDAIFPNRNFSAPYVAMGRNWHLLYVELNARMILFEFKNFNRMTIGQDEVSQVNKYMQNHLGQLAFLVTNKKPAKSAYIMRHIIYKSQKRVILFLTKKTLIDMLIKQDKGEDPSDLVIDLLESFYGEQG